MIFSIFRFFCTLRFQIFKYCPIITNHTSMERLFIQLLLRLVLYSKVSLTHTHTHTHTHTQTQSRWDNVVICSDSVSALMSIKSGVTRNQKLLHEIVLTNSRISRQGKNITYIQASRETRKYPAKKKTIEAQWFPL